LTLLKEMEQRTFRSYLEYTQGNSHSDRLEWDWEAV